MYSPYIPQDAENESDAQSDSQATDADDGNSVENSASEAESNSVKPSPDAGTNGSKDSAAPATGGDCSTNHFAADGQS